MHKDKKVRQTLRTPFDEIDDSKKLVPNVVSLIRYMAKAADVRLGTELDDDFFARPFTPPKSLDDQATNALL